MVNHCDGVRLGEPCRTLFAVGLTRCPHCRSTDFHEFGSQPGDEEHPMAKITVLTGPSDASLPAEEVPSAEETQPEPTAPELESEGTGVEMEAIEVELGEEAELTNDGSGEALPPAHLDYTDGTIDHVLGWVGDDSDRALVALDAEKAKGDEARSTLVDKLTKLVDDATG